MLRQPSGMTRRQFIATAALTSGTAALGAFVAPALGQQPKLVYWAYQFLRSSDEARVNFAQEWAAKNKVEMQITLVPWKEFMTKITAAIQAQATPDIVESGGVELRDPLGVGDGVERHGCITLGLPDPCQDGQAAGQWPGETSRRHRSMPLVTCRSPASSSLC